MRLWITRAQPGANATAARLRVIGHEAVVAPLLEVRPIRKVKIDLDGVAALAFTSANGVGVFARLNRRRDLTVFAVGDATASMCRELGFIEVRSADGDVDALARLIALVPPDGMVLHIAPTEPAGDLVGALAALGVQARSLPVYETVVLKTRPPEDVDAALVYSAKAARALAAVASPELPVFALSEACAEPLREAGFFFVKVAPFPRENSMVKFLVEGIRRPNL